MENVKLWLIRETWKELKGLIGAPITAYIKEYIDSLDNTKRAHKAWFFMGLLHEEVTQKIAELATKPNFEISELIKILTKGGNKLI